MSTEQNKQLVRRFFKETHNKDTLDSADVLLAPDYVNHDFPGIPPGPAGFKQVMGAYLAAFPGMRVTLEDQVAESDTVVTRGVMHATQTGEFMGIPATGRPVAAKFISAYRIKGNQIVENWFQMDMLGMLQQLGVIPTPEAATR